MSETRSESIEVQTEHDVVRARHAVRDLAIAVGLRLVDQTKLITAASELARNMTRYAGGGVVTLSVLDDGARQGVRAVFADEGPGIPDLELAMRNGYTTGDGLGLGLGGAKRLVNDFDIQTTPGRGTTVTVAMWA